MKLSATQHLFTKAVIERNNDAAEWFANYLQANPKLPPESAISIYRSNYQGALTNTLEHIYPVCRKIVGEECFTGLAHQYVRLRPSSNPDLNQYGDQFAEFIHHDILQLSAFEALPYLADLAKLEYSWHKLYYADDCTETDFTTIRQLPDTEASQLQLGLNPSLALLDSPYPVLDIWNLNRNDKLAYSVEPINETLLLVIVRYDFEPGIQQVGQKTYDALTIIKHGTSLQALLDNPAFESTELIESILPGMIKNQWVNVIAHQNNRTTHVKPA